MKSCKSASNFLISKIKSKAIKQKSTKQILKDFDIMLKMKNIKNNIFSNGTPNIYFQKSESKAKEVNEPTQTQNLFSNEQSEPIFSQINSTRKILPSIQKKCEIKVLKYLENICHTDIKGNKSKKILGSTTKSKNYANEISPWKTEENLDLI